MEEKAEYKGLRYFECPLEFQKGRGVWRRKRIPLGTTRHLGRSLRRSEDLADDDEAWAEEYALLATLVPRWDLVDEEGELLPQPCDDPMAFDLLDGEEFTWLMRDVMVGDAAPSR